jgi:DNA repair protein RadC
MLTTHPSLNQLCQEDRPQEKMERLGSGALSDIELLALLLRSGYKGRDVLHVARNILTESNGLGGLMQWTAEDLSKLPGIGPVKAAQLMTVIELSRRILKLDQTRNPLLDNSEKVFHYMQPHSMGLSIEKFWILCLNRKNRLIKWITVSTGTATGSLVHAREVFREAIRSGAVGIICCHNHPSGDPAPSQADRMITRQIQKAGELLDIPILDHVILGNVEYDPLNQGYYSFSDAGLLK